MRKILSAILVTLFLGVNMLSAQNSEFLSFKKYERSKGEQQSTLPKRIISDSRSQDFIVEYNFDGGLLTSKKVNNESYNFVYIEDFSFMKEVGKPAVPSHNDLIAISAKENTSIEIIEADFIEYDNIYIHPALKPERDTYGAEQSPFEKDSETYSTNAFYPENIVEITSVQDLRNVNIAITQIRPVQFNPVTQKIRVYSKIKYRIIDNVKDIESTPLYQNSDYYNNQLKKLVLNKSFLNNTIAKDSKAELEGNNYIIITHSEYDAAADSLAKWKRQMGYSVEVVSQDSWTTAQVKEAVHSRYQNWTLKPDYFVIIGDHTGDYAVPGEVHQDPSYGEDFATDLYYACMGGDGDYWADMAHGRISVSSATEAMTVIRKIINYERDPVYDPAFYQNGLNCAQFQDVADSEAPDGYAARRFCHTSENIRDYMINEQNYSVERIYYTDENNTPTNFNDGHYSNGEPIPDELLRENGFKWDGGPTEITASIEAGKFYVFHRDHGYSGGWGWSHPGFYSNNSYNYPNNVAALENGNKLPVLFSINCHTGEFALPNCFAEEFLRNPNGGVVGVIGAAYYSYSGYNDGLSCGMIDAIWSDPGLTPTFGSGGQSNPVASSANNTYTMGDVMNQGLVRMTETWHDNEYTWKLFHWFGDPAMKIWTGDPYNDTIKGNFPDKIDNINEYSFSEVNVNGVASIVADGVLINSASIIEGKCDIDLTGLSKSATEILLTISYHNYKPLIKELSLVDQKPNAAFDADTCFVDFDKDSVIHLIDESTNFATSWDWIISPGEQGVDYEYIESTSNNSQNPIVKFSTAGYYSVAQFASNSKGTDTLVRENFLKVDTIALGANQVTFNISSSTNPVKDAQVYILGLDTLLTDAAGTVVYDSVPNGSHYTYTVIAKGYMPESDTINVSGDMVVNHELIPMKTITEIQYTTDLSGNSPVKDQIVNVEGIITGIVAGEGVFIQSSGDEWSGLYIHTTSTEKYYVGDNISVKGLISEENSYTTVKNSEILILSRWNEINPISVSSTQAISENMEGMLVTIDNIECTNINIETGYWQVGDDQDSISISKVLLDYAPTAVCHYSVTGVVYCKDGKNVIIPRNESDVELLTFTLTFKVTDINGGIYRASIKSELFGSLVTDSEGLAVVTDVLPQNDLSIEVIKSGYKTHTESFDMDGADLTKNITLTELPRYDVNFTILNEDSEVIVGAEVVFASENMQTSNTSGKVVFTDMLAKNDLMYSVYASGYQGTSGTINIVDQDVNETVTLSLIRYNANFEITSTTGKVEAAAIKIGSETINTDAEGKATFELTDGEYSYEITKTGFYNLSGTINIDGKDITEKIEIVGTSVDELESLGIKLFPNPSNGIFKLEGDKLPGSKVKIMDVSGKIVLEQKINSSLETVVFDGTTGVYIIEISTGDNTVQGKLMIK